MARYHNILFGIHGELVAKAMLEHRGYVAERYGGTNGFDIIVNNKVTVDVKAALLSGPGGRRGYGWQFNLHRNKRRYVEMIVLCLCFNSPRDEGPITFFVIPGEDARDLQKISISSRDPRTYSGKWMQHRESWQALDMVLRTASEFVECEIEIPF